MRHDAVMWIAVAISLLGGCEEPPQHKTTDTQPDRLHWQQDGPLPKGKINAGSTVTMDTTATPPVEVLSPATSGDSLYRPLNSAIEPGDQVMGRITLSSGTPVDIRLFIARNDNSPWEASQCEVTIGPTPTIHTISHTFKSPHQDARLQIALLSDTDTLLIHDASVQFVLPSCDWHVIAVSTLPDPQTADYADCLDVMHLKRPDSCGEPHEALVALRTMTDRTLTSAANIKLGDLLTIDTLTPWSETPESIRSIRTVQDMDEFHLPMYFGDGSKVVGQRAPSASTVTQRPVVANADETLAPAPSQGQTQWIADDLAAINQIAADHGGWQKWADSLDGFRRDLRRRVPDNVTLIGDDWLASKGRADSLQDSVMCRQPNDDVIYPKATETIINTAAKLNARGIDLIVIPVPPRAEVMPEKFGGEPTELVAPQRYRFMKQLLSSGVEVVDVLPAMMDAKADATAEDPVVFAADPHWASRGLYAAAATLAPRISRYQQVDQSLVVPPLTVGTTPENAALLRETPDDFRAGWPIREIQFRSIEPNTHGGPAVLLITDSYGAVHSREKGDFSRHLSAMSGVPIERLSEGGAGPRVPAILARNNGEALRERDVVIWLFVARYLPDRTGWKPALPSLQN